jgi:hypothetical protein
MSKWLKDLLEETMYKHYFDTQPELVSGIRKLLTAGQKPKEIRRWVEGKIGKRMSSNCIGHMIDYVNKQVNQ